MISVVINTIYRRCSYFDR